MKNVFLKTYAVFLFLWLVNLSGCATTSNYGPLQSNFESEDELLSNLRKREATKEQLVELLGTPDDTFINVKVITYKIIADENGRYLIAILTTYWKSVSYNLVLVFGNDHILDEYSLVSIE